MINKTKSVSNSGHPETKGKGTGYKVGITPKNTGNALFTSPSLPVAQAGNSVLLENANKMLAEQNYAGLVDMKNELSTLTRDEKKPLFIRIAKNMLTAMEGRLMSDDLANAYSIYLQLKELSGGNLMPRQERIENLVVNLIEARMDGHLKKDLGWQQAMDVLRSFRETMPEFVSLYDDRLRMRVENQMLNTLQRTLEENDEMEFRIMHNTGLSHEDRMKLFDKMTINEKEITSQVYDIFWKVPQAYGKTENLLNAHGREIDFPKIFSLNPFENQPDNLRRLYCAMGDFFIQNLKWALRGLDPQNPQASAKDWVLANKIMRDIVKHSPGHYLELTDILHRRKLTMSVYDALELGPQATNGQIVRAYQEKLKQCNGLRGIYENDFGLNLLLFDLKNEVPVILNEEFRLATVAMLRPLN